MKNKRKKKLIDFSFQLKTAVPAVIISMTSFAVIIGFIILIIRMPESGSAITTGRELDWAVNNEDNIVASFKEYAKRVKDPIFILATEKIEADHDKSIAVIKENLKILKAYSERNIQLLALSIAMMIANGVILFLYLIRSTHRAAGSVRVMNRYVRDLLEGRNPALRKLRKHDAFQEFHEDVTRLAEKYRNKTGREGTSKTTSVSGNNHHGRDRENPITNIRIMKHE
jgi:hypothetical protein